MERTSPFRTVLGPLFPAVVLFALVFWTTLEIDLRHDSALGQAFQGHLLYCLRSKDDMGTIDWGKSLESVPGVKAFSVSKDGSRIVSGGNLQTIPDPGPNGARFALPDSIIYETEFLSAGTSKVRFTFLSEPLLDPWGSAGLAALLSLLWGLFFLLKGQRSERTPIAGPVGHEGSKELPRKPKDKQPLTENPSTDFPTNGLLLDAQFKILKFGDQTPGFLDLSQESLLNGHLLDLLPDPSLLLAMEKGQKQKLSGVFPKGPGLSVNLEPTPNGFLLVLEPAESSQTPKKP